VTSDFSVVVAGHICLDIVPDMRGISQSSFEQLFLPGRLIVTGPAALSTGGPVSNTGLALHKLGVPTRLMGKVGDDLFGQAMIGIVRTFGPQLADGMIVDPAVSSSYTVIISPPGFDRIFLHDPSANDTFGADDIRYDLLKGARLFHFGYPPLMKLMYIDDGRQCAEVFRRAKQTGVTTSLDMALPDPSSPGGRMDWVKILRATLPHVDVFLPSIEEILYMLRRETYDALWHNAKGHDILPLITPALLSDLSDELLELGPKIVGLKLGYRGLYLRTGRRAALEGMGRARPSDAAGWADRELWSPCFKVNLVGAAGSGDSTIAGFLSALLRDLPPDEAVTVAVAVGACNVEAADTLSGVRPWDETLQRVAAGWERHALDLEAPGWRFDSGQQIWRRTGPPA